MSRHHLIAVALILLVCPSFASATIVIDNFSQPSTFNTPFFGTSEALGQVITGGTDLTPAVRKIGVSSYSASGFDSINLTQNSNVYSHTNNGTAFGTSYLRWDGTLVPNTNSTNLNGGTGVDLTQGGTEYGIAFTTFASAPGSSIEIILTNGTGGGATTFSSGLIAVPTINSLLDIQYGSFIGLDPTAVTAIELRIVNPVLGSTVSLTNGFTTIPEPSTVGLLGFAAIGGVWFARRRRKAEVAA